MQNITASALCPIRIVVLMRGSARDVSLVLVTPMTFECMRSFSPHEILKNAARGNPFSGAAVVFAEGGEASQYQVPLMCTQYSVGPPRPALCTLIALVDNTVFGTAKHTELPRGPYLWRVSRPQVLPRWYAECPGGNRAAP